MKNPHQHAYLNWFFILTPTNELLAFINIFRLCHLDETYPTQKIKFHSFFFYFYHLLLQTWKIIIECAHSVTHNSHYVSALRVCPDGEFDLLHGNGRGKGEIGKGRFDEMSGARTCVSRMVNDWWSGGDWRMSDLMMYLIKDQRSSTVRMSLLGECQLNAI